MIPLILLLNEIRAPEYSMVGNILDIEVELERNQ
jgi:hypothetical protein